MHYIFWYAKNFLSLSVNKHLLKKLSELQGLEIVEILGVEKAGVT